VIHTVNTGCIKGSISLSVSLSHTHTHTHTHKPVPEASEYINTVVAKFLMQS